ncbi:MAG: 30S ribosomal protein S10 [Candidatus Pacebacteria bacterium]|nr:30S ribosomal protein S10 [Candidatus Paceibacterota bacterium]
MVVKDKEKKVVKKTTVESKKNVSATGHRKVEKKKGNKTATVSNLRIIMTAYEHKILDASIKQIMDTAFKYDVKIRGPVPLPTSIKKYTVNRSSFIFKDAREQFEMRAHKRLVDILSPSQKVIEALTNLSLPAGVDINVKLM